MTDYNSKDIPTLDDIIEDANDDVSTGLAEPDDTTGTEYAQPYQTESDEPENDDSIIDGSIDTDNGNADYETRVAQNTHVSEVHQSPPETHSSLQINYQEAYNKQTSLIQESDSAQEQTTESEQNTTAPLNSVILATIVDEVVEQLLPEIEHQLKHRIKQALDDKLPDEINGSSDIDEP